MSLENDSTSNDNQTGLNYSNSINTFHTSKSQNHNVSVGSQIVAQTQIEKGMGPISPVQKICKRVGERIRLIKGLTTINGG